MIENVDDPTEIKRYRDVVEISQSMFAGNYDDLRNNRKIETESFMMAATFTCTALSPITSAPTMLTACPSGFGIRSPASLMTS